MSSNIDYVTQYQEPEPKFGRRVVINAEDPDLRDMCELFWQRRSGDWEFSVREIANTYDLSPSQVAKFAGEYSRVEFQRTCAQCRAEVWLPGASRKAVLDIQHGRIGIPRCEPCTEKARHAERESEERERQRIAQERREQKESLIRDFVESVNSHSDFGDLSLRDAIGLVALVRNRGADGFWELESTSRSAIPLTPTSELDWLVMSRLSSIRRLFVHSDSPLGSYEISEGAMSIDPARVRWRIAWCNGKVSASAQFDQLEKLVLTRDSWPNAWSAEIRPIAEEIAVHECLGYLKLQLELHHLPYRIAANCEDSKFYASLKTVLRQFTIPQVWNIIYGKVVKAVAWHQRDQVPKSVVVNSLPNSIQQFAEKAYAENWTVAKYGRDFRLPQSTISSLFFHGILGFSESGLDFTIESL